MLLKSDFSVQTEKKNHQICTCAFFNRNSIIVQTSTNESKTLSNTD